jgi:heme exporter protein ccmD
MSFTSLSDFLRMGTHGVYVWTAYGLTLAALVAIHLNAARRQRRLRQTLATLKRHDDAR